MLYPGTTLNIVTDKILTKSWEQFITSTGSDKVCGGHKSSSWVKPAKHFSAPSILQELTRLIETTARSFAVVTRSPDKEKYFCSLAITVDIGHNEKPIAPCYEVQAEEVCLYWNLMQKTGVLAKPWVGGCFFLRCRWIFRNHFHFSGWVLHVMDWSSMCCCSVITNTVAKSWFILMLGTLKKRAYFLIAAFSSLINQLGAVDDKRLGFYTQSTCLNTMVSYYKCICQIHFPKENRVAIQNLQKSHAVFFCCNHCVLSLRQ